MEEERMRNASSIVLLAACALVLFFFFAPATASAGPIIIDHTAVDKFNTIPDFYISEAKKMWLNIPGESHASGYRKGLTLLAQQNPKFAAVATESGNPEPYREDALRISGLNLNQWNDWDSGAGEDKWYTWRAYSSTSYPIASTLIKNHLTYCNTHNLVIAAIGFGWCWDMTWHNGPGGGLDPVYNVHWAGSSEGGPEGDLRWGLDADDYVLTGNSVSMDTYLNATEEYAAYCRANNYKTKVLFTTGPVDSYSDESGYERQLKHDYIRAFVKADATRILFDYADILSYNDAGVENRLTWNGNTYQMIHPDNMKDLNGGYTEDGDHIGQVGAVRLGKALWVLAARLAGWDGTTGGGGDTTAPTVSLTAPAAGANLTGSSVTVSAVASDNVGVRGVQFKLDGNNLGAEVTSSPYQISWDTTQAANGSHTLTAVARDAAGNTATASGISVSVSNSTTPPPTGGLVGYWKLDEGSGTQATDSSASGNNGSFVGSPSWTSGKIGGALTFNGASYVNIPNAVYSTSAGTLSLWVKNTGGGVVIGSYNGATTSRTPTFSFTGSASQKAGWEFSDKTGQTTSTTVSPTTWTHLALTYSGGNVSVYVNGVLDTQTTASLPTTFYNQVHIGHYANYGSLYFNGLVDDVRIYSRALSASEIQALYNSSTILYGDVSGDGKVSAYDAALVGQYAVSLITLTPEQITCADVSGDGKVSAYDAALIAQYAVGLISKFPVES